MKKSLLFLAILCGFCFAQAQNDTMYLMKKGNILGKYNVSAIDSVVFYKPNPISPLLYNEYLLSGSYGDLIRFEVDKINNKYSYFNETTTASGKGNFVYSSNPNLIGVYEISSGNNFYYGIELADKMFATSFPSGNQQNLLCFGITAETNLTTQYRAADFAGKYIWVNYNSLLDFEWGGYEIFANGTFTWQFGPADDNDFDESKHFAGAGAGTWAISLSDPTRIVFTDKGESSIGTVYPNKFMLADNGYGKGFCAGVKYPANAISQASIAGNYRWLGVSPEGYLGVGTFTLPAIGTSFNYYYKYYNNPYASEGNKTMTNFRPSSKIKNAFIGQDIWDNELFYTSFIVLPGEALLYYSWGKDGIVSYGVASKIN